jgi:hypothetical protein
MLADVFAYAAADGVELRIDGSETQVRLQRAHWGGPAGVCVGHTQAAHHQDHHDL